MEITRQDIQVAMCSDKVSPLKYCGPRLRFDNAIVVLLTKTALTYVLSFVSTFFHAF